MAKVKTVAEFKSIISQSIKYMLLFLEVGEWLVIPDCKKHPGHLRLQYLELLLSGWLTDEMSRIYCSNQINSCLSELKEEGKINLCLKVEIDSLENWKHYRVISKGVNFWSLPKNEEVQNLIKIEDSTHFAKFLCEYSFFGGLYIPPSQALEKLYPREKLFEIQIISSGMSFYQTTTRKGLFNLINANIKEINNKCLRLWILNIDAREPIWGLDVWTDSGGNPVKERLVAKHINLKKEVIKNDNTIATTTEKVVENIVKMPDVNTKQDNTKPSIEVDTLKQIVKDLFTVKIGVKLTEKPSEIKSDKSVLHEIADVLHWMAEQLAKI